MQQYIPWEKIAALQKEIDQLKSLGKKKVGKKGKPKKDPLYGILADAFKGIKVTEKDFKEAKKSLFPYDEHIK